MEGSSYLHSNFDEPTGTTVFGAAKQLVSRVLAYTRTYSYSPRDLGESRLNGNRGLGVAVPQAGRPPYRQQG